MLIIGDLNDMQVFLSSMCPFGHIYDIVCVHMRKDGSLTCKRTIKLINVTNFIISSDQYVILNLGYLHVLFILGSYVKLLTN